MFLASKCLKGFKLGSNSDKTAQIKKIKKTLDHLVRKEFLKPTIPERYPAESPSLPGMLATISEGMRVLGEA